MSTWHILPVDDIDGQEIIEEFNEILKGDWIK